MGRSATTNDTGHSESPNKIVCPKCGGTHVHRSRRGHLEKWFSWYHSGQKTFRCYGCQHRFWDFKKIDRPIPMSAASQASGALADKNEAGKKRRARSNRNSGVTNYHRFQEWLYRKHSLTVGILVTLAILAGLMLFLMFMWMEQMD